jgi:hypothetical protein
MTDFELMLQLRFIRVLRTCRPQFIHSLPNVLVALERIFESPRSFAEHINHKCDSLKSDSQLQLMAATYSLLSTLAPVFGDAVLGEWATSVARTVAFAEAAATSAAMSILCECDSVHVRDAAANAFHTIVQTLCVDCQRSRW